MATRLLPRTGKRLRSTANSKATDLLLVWPADETTKLDLAEVQAQSPDSPAAWQRIGKALFVIHGISTPESRNRRPEVNRLGRFDVQPGRDRIGAVHATHEIRDHEAFEAPLAFQQLAEQRSIVPQ